MNQFSKITPHTQKDHISEPPVGFSPNLIRMRKNKLVS